MIKKALRQDIKERLSVLSPQEIHERSLRACAHLIETREYQEAEAVMVFTGR